MDWSHRKGLIEPFRVSMLLALSGVLALVALRALGGSVVGGR
jgi:hypothetical protein